jgi:N-terminal acetyltransferase B complex non-catalytic subunit
MGTILELSKLTGEKRTEEELELWDEAAKVLFPSRQGPEAKAICRLRVDAVKASPKDERLALVCFQACLKRGDIESTQSVCITSYFST